MTFPFLHPAITWVAVPSWAVGVGVGAGLILVTLARRLRRATARAERKAQLLLARSEQDRNRLAKALHDGPVQDLLAMQMETRVAAYLGSDEQMGDVSVVIRRLRDVSEALRPPALDVFGLAAALVAHAERFRARHPGLAVSLDLDDDGLAPATRLALFRIAQEALDNAARHGRPARVDVALAVSDAGAELVVRDDGEGWEVPDDVTTLAHSGRYGVFGMLAHADSVGAELEIQSALGHTVIRVSAPPSPPDRT